MTRKYKVLCSTPATARYRVYLDNLIGQFGMNKIDARIIPMTASQSGRRMLQVEVAEEHYDKAKGIINGAYGEDA